MTSFVAVAYVVGYALAFVALGQACVLAWRHRDRHRIEVAVILASLALRRFVPFGTMLTFALPYLALRLVRHFRMVSKTSEVLAIGVIAAYLAWSGIPRGTLSTLLLRFAFVVGAGLLILEAGVFWVHAHRTTGVTRRRVTYAGIGCAAAATGHIIAFGVDGGYQAYLAVTAVAFIAFFMAFAPPRRLQARWQALEQARQLREQLSIDPIQRGSRAAAQLQAGALRSIDTASALVALRQSAEESILTIEVSTDATMIGRRLVPRDGLIGQCMRSGNVAHGPPSGCEPEIRSWCQERGHHVRVIPIVGQAFRWGVLLTVQRVGSLFPEDDDRLLAGFAQQAATALDHAYLLVAERERQRQAAARQVRQVETHLAAMLDSLADCAIVSADTEGRVVNWHESAVRVFHRQAVDVKQQSLAALFSWTPTELLDRLQEARERGRTSMEGLYARPDGSTFVGITTIQPVDGEQGGPGFVVITQDVTHQRDLEQQLGQSQKLEAIGRLAGGIAHDFNNLLTAIRGYADSLSRELADQPSRHRQVAQIQRAAGRAADLTRQLLAFGRRQRLQPAPLSLSDLVEDVTPLLRRLIGENIDVVCRLGTNLPPIRADHGQLEQVLLNLAINARDAMPTGGRLAITTSGVELDSLTAADEVPPGPHVMLEVQDAGVGMDEATAARIFEPFFTTKAVGRGTGLGLSMIHGIVRQMGGIIRVESAPGAGTTFRVYFPETHELVQRQPVTIPPNAPRGTETILVVEDDVSVRTFLEDVLTQQGYRVLVAEHGEAALELAHDHREIDLILADIVLPGQNGLETVSRLEAIQPGIPALFISGYADPTAPAFAALAAADQVLAKPFSAEDLLIRLRQVLGPGGSDGLDSAPG